MVSCPSLSEQRLFKEPMENSLNGRLPKVDLGVRSISFPIAARLEELCSLLKVLKAMYNIVLFSVPWLTKLLRFFKLHLELLLEWGGYKETA